MYTYIMIQKVAFMKERERGENEIPWCQNGSRKVRKVGY